MPPPGQIPLVQKNLKLHPSLVVLDVVPLPSLPQLLAEVQEFLPLPSSSCLSSFFFSIDSKRFLHVSECDIVPQPSQRGEPGVTPVLIHPSLCNVLSSYHRIPDRTVRLGIRRSTHDAIQGVFAVTVTLWQPIDRSAVPDPRESPEQMFTPSALLCQPKLPAPIAVRRDSRDDLLSL